MAIVYKINKGVSRPIVFRGLKAQYIACLAIGLVLLLLSFAILYISGLSLFFILPTIIFSGSALFVLTFHLSNRFGEHGLMKYMAKKRLPKYIRFSSRKIFTTLKYNRVNHQ